MPSLNLQFSPQAAVSFTWRGTWLVGTAYNTYDVVYSTTTSSAYVAVAPSTGVDPSTEAARTGR